MIVVPVTHALIHFATVHAARLPPSLLDEVAEERGAWRTHTVDVDVAVQGLVHSEHELSHSHFLSLRVIRSSCVPRWYLARHSVRQSRETDIETDQLGGKAKSPASRKRVAGLKVAPPGIEPGLSCSRVRRDASSPEGHETPPHRLPPCQFGGASVK